MADNARQLVRINPLLKIDPVSSEEQERLLETLLKASPELLKRADDANALNPQTLELEAIREIFGENAFPGQTVIQWLGRQLRDPQGKSRLTFICNIPGLRWLCKHELYTELGIIISLGISEHFGMPGTVPVHIGVSIAKYHVTKLCPENQDANTRTPAASGSTTAAEPTSRPANPE